MLGDTLLYSCHPTYCEQNQSPEDGGETNFGNTVYINYTSDNYVSHELLIRYNSL
jgi:hypothetical protein